jgi:geranylgeranyl pyrophosphate synthase
MAALEEIRAVLDGEGGLLAAALLDGRRADSEALGARVAAGPRAAADPAAYAFVVEAIHEGHLLHDGRSRLLDQSDPDLALLAGDRLYALGLERLAGLGDLEAVAILAEVISRCAQARAEGTPQLAAQAWEDATRQLAGDVAP